MENSELLTEVRARINEVTQQAIANRSVTMDILFLFTQLQILEKLEAMHERLRCIESDVNATANIVAEQAKYPLLGKRDAS